MTALPLPPLRHDDPMLDEIRRVKQAVSARVGHDVSRLCRELRQEQEQSTAKVVRRRTPDAGRTTAL
jgi:hypothetical protein